jgi:hypothetical protein
MAVGMAAAHTALSVAVGLCVAVYVATALANSERPYEAISALCSVVRFILFPLVVVWLAL